MTACFIVILKLLVNSVLSKMYLKHLVLLETAE